MTSPYMTPLDYMSFEWLVTLSAETSNKVALLIDALTYDFMWEIWDLRYWPKQEQIAFDEIINADWQFPTIFLRNPRVKSIDAINGKSYVWTVNMDFQITGKFQNRFESRNLVSYIAPLIFNHFTIDYTSWFQTTPNDLKLLISLCISWELAKQDWQEIKSYTLWPRTLVFRDKNDMDRWLRILWCYTLPIL